jgi:peptidoglycan/LPS O-acetylase OafA/YrhL
VEHVFLPAEVIEYLHYNWCFSFGGLGIGVFTFISGFSIAGSLASQTPREFASSRFWRIYPTYICVLCIAWAVHSYFGYSRLVPTEEVTPRGLWAQVFFVRDIFNMYNPLISGDWTLLYELQLWVFAGFAWLPI